MIRWPKCADNGGPKECLGHIEQVSDKRLYCDECHTEFKVAVGDHSIFGVDGKAEDDKLSETETLKIVPGSILVYTPAETMSQNAYGQTYDTLQRAACKALACAPAGLSVGIIILKPGDKLEILPSMILLKEISQRLAKIEEKVGK